MDYCTILLVFIILYVFVHLTGLFEARREGFVSKEQANALYAVTNPLYNAKGDTTTYSEFKVAVEPVYKEVGADTFIDTKKAFVSNPTKYNAETIQQALA